MTTPRDRCPPASAGARRRLAWLLSLGLLASAWPLAHAAAEPLGRLFSTPAERAALDASRGNAGAAAPPPQPEPEPANVAVAPPSVTLNGVVRRSNGRSTVWLNQVAQDDAGHQVRANKGAATLTVRTASGQRVTLKPGQRYDPDNGSIKEDQQP